MRRTVVADNSGSSGEREGGKERKDDQRDGANDARCEALRRRRSWAGGGDKGRTREKQMAKRSKARSKKATNPIAP